MNIILYDGQILQESNVIVIGPEFIFSRPDLNVNAMKLDLLDKSIESNGFIQNNPHLIKNNCDLNIRHIKEYFADLNDLICGNQDDCRGGNQDNTENAYEEDTKDCNKKGNLGNNHYSTFTVLVVVVIPDMRRSEEYANVLRSCKLPNRIKVTFSLEFSPTIPIGGISTHGTPTQLIAYYYSLLKFGYQGIYYGAFHIQDYEDMSTLLGVLQDFEKEHSLQICSFYIGWKSGLLKGKELGCKLYSLSEIDTFPYSCNQVSATPIGFEPRNGKILGIHKGSPFYRSGICYRSDFRLSGGIGLKYILAWFTFIGKEFYHERAVQELSNRILHAQVEVKQEMEKFKCDVCNLEFTHEPLYKFKYQYCTSSCILVHRSRNWK